MIRIDRQKCVGCGGCVDLYSQAAIGFSEDFALIHKGLCFECRTCFKVCPMKALQEI